MMLDSELSRLTWRKSSHSGGGNDCVEVARPDAGGALRDSKAPQAGVLRLGAAAWSGLLDTVRATE